MDDRVDAQLWGRVVRKKVGNPLLRYLVLLLSGVPVVQIGSTNFGSLADGMGETKIGAVQFGAT
jgi:hypothetical protein